MFYFIRGRVDSVMPSLVVIDAGGVGYGLNTSYTSSSSVKVGDNVTFYTYLHVREDIFDLYGFATVQELNCFKLLIGISGVGPKAAIAILGSVSPDKLAMCVISDDEKTLCTAPGIGKKLAQRIILELKDKLAKGQMSAITDSASAMGEEPVSGGVIEDAIAALAVLGYPRAVTMGVLRGEALSGLGTDDIVRLALKKLF